MPKMASIRTICFSIVLASFPFAGCATEPLLIISNKTKTPITVQFLSQTEIDSTRYSLASGSTDTIETGIFSTSSKVKELELHGIVVRSGLDEILQVMRISASYLNTRSWRISFPFDHSDEMRKALESKTTLEETSHNLYHFAQELYNSSRFTHCVEVTNFGITATAVSSQHSAEASRAANAQDVSQYEGLVIIGYLAAKKLSIPGLADRYWRIMEENVPHVGRNLKKNDIEFSE